MKLPSGLKNLGQSQAFEGAKKSAKKSFKKTKGKAGSRKTNAQVKGMAAQDKKAAGRDQFSRAKKGDFLGGKKGNFAKGASGAGKFLMGAFKQAGHQGMAAMSKPATMLEAGGRAAGTFAKKAGGAGTHKLAKGIESAADQAVINAPIGSKALKVAGAVQDGAKKVADEGLGKAGKSAAKAAGGKIASGLADGAQKAVDSKFGQAAKGAGKAVGEKAAELGAQGKKKMAGGLGSLGEKLTSTATKMTSD